MFCKKTIQGKKEVKNMSVHFLIVFELLLN